MSGWVRLGSVDDNAASSLIVETRNGAEGSSGCHRRRSTYRFEPDARASSFTGSARCTLFSGEHGEVFGGVDDELVGMRGRAAAFTRSVRNNAARRARRFVVFLKRHDNAGVIR